MTITMKKNNSDQTKGKPWTESVNFKLNVKECNYQRNIKCSRMVKLLKI